MSYPTFSGNVQKTKIHASWCPAPTCVSQFRSKGALNNIVSSHATTMLERFVYNSTPQVASLAGDRHGVMESAHDGATRSLMCNGTSDPLLYERTRAYVRLHKLQQCLFKQ